MNNTLNSFQNSGAMLNFPCQFQVKNGNIFSLVYQLIKETRRLEKNMKQVNFQRNSKKSIVI